MRIVFYSGLKPPIPRREFGAEASDSGEETQKTESPIKLGIFGEVD